MSSTLETVERKNSLTGRNLKQNQTQCGRPSASTGWGWAGRKMGRRGEKRERRGKRREKLLCYSEGKLVDSSRPLFCIQDTQGADAWLPPFCGDGVRLHPCAVTWLLCVFTLSMKHHHHPETCMETICIICSVQTSISHLQPQSPPRWLGVARPWRLVQWNFRLRDWTRSRRRLLPRSRARSWPTPDGNRRTSSWCPKRHTHSGRRAASFSAHGMMALTQRPWTPTTSLFAAWKARTAPPHHPVHPHPLSSFSSYADVEVLGGEFSPFASPTQASRWCGAGAAEAVM